MRIMLCKSDKAIFVVVVIWDRVYLCDQEENVNSLTITSKLVRELLN